MKCAIAFCCAVLLASSGRGQTNLVPPRIALHPMTKALQTPRMSTTRTFFPPPSTRGQMKNPAYSQVVYVWQSYYKGMTNVQTCVEARTGHVLSYLGPWVEIARVPSDQEAITNQLEPNTVQIVRTRSVMVGDP